MIGKHFNFNGSVITVEAVYRISFDGTIYRCSYFEVDKHRPEYMKRVYCNISENLLNKLEEFPF